VDPLRRAVLARPPRTLIDILRATVDQHPDAPAMDDGNSVLTYTQLWRDVQATAARLAAAGVRPGDRVGVRLPSGTHLLYTSILGVLAAGAAYVPVDADDPDERAALVFSEADVAAVLADGGLDVRRPAPGPLQPRPVALDDDAWIIFTSGSTGTPKGVAVSHRSAAAFVDAEARLFLKQHPIGPGDRVLAGLSVAFDASCEEMWLAWRYGACLVPAPRALVRSGVDLGPWLVAQRITMVSTVPTLASLWPAEALDAIRLLIFGGEACPPELAARLATPDRELWNTYGPTEATVVACAAPLTGSGPVRIGLPLDGWDLAVVDKEGEPVDEGEIGELIIGGVGLARYLDPTKDAQMYAPMPTLGWARAYRSGDLVRHDPAGLLFIGRADDQVKLGGRRIELGEVDAALQALPGVAGAAAAVRRTEAGNQLLVGYVALAEAGEAALFDQADAVRRLREQLPAALVPRLAIVDTIPTRTSGKVDRDGLPWPLSSLAGLGSDDAGGARFIGTARWVAEQWTRILGATPAGLDDDFFAHGGSSLSAAQLVSTLRARFPEVTVADVYESPGLGALADRLDEFAPTVSSADRTVGPVPVRAQLLQLLLSVPLATVVGLRWLTWLGLLVNVLGASSTGSATGSLAWAPHVSWWWVAAGWLMLISPVGRMAGAAAGARLVLRGVRPGSYPRGGAVHLRLWFAESLANAAGAENLAGAPWISYYARALGCNVGRDVDLHAVPPVTGLLTLGKGCSIEPEVDLSGHWLDGDVLRLGRIRVGAGATIGARSTLAPGARVGQGCEIAAGSAVSGPVPPGELWAGSPARFAGMARHDWPARQPGQGRRWVGVYGVSAAVLATLPLLAALAGLSVIAGAVDGAPSLGDAARAAVAWSPVATLVGFAAFGLLILICVRLFGLGLSKGYHPVRSRVGWQVWATERLMDDARTWLFPIYASLFTPVWLRLLGARIGRGVEASTVLMLPAMTSVGDGAFLADDTLIGSYELGNGWLRIEPAKVGKRAFLGNSGMTAPGRTVPKDSLVAVLSATPKRARSGTSWVGSPPVQMRRTAKTVDASRTFAPPLRLKVARGVVEVLRLVPTICTVALALVVLFVLQATVHRFGGPVAALLSGFVVLAAAVVAAAVTTVAKWLLVGRIGATEYPLWSSFVWRNELADTFVEMLAAPWLTRSAVGTPAITWWFRSLGARIGRGVWCETYWLPEADLVRLDDASTVNRGCVVQTHLFHDRILAMDSVTLRAGATLGPHSVVLPAAVIGVSTTVGPSSLVMRGESVPSHTRWTGNPIAFWADPAASV
jgi:non-ribosomal peptide synthetase-like protein